MEIENTIGKNLFETYEVNGKTYTDNIGSYAIAISKKQYIEYNQQKEEIEKLNKELEDLRKLNDANYKSFIDANKVIIELEEYLNKVIETSSEMERITCSFVLQYLKELKGEK